MAPTRGLTGDPGSVALFTRLTDGFWLSGFEKPVRLLPAR